MKRIKEYRITSFIFASALLLVFTVGYFIGRKSQNARIIELEQSAKMIGWWNQQLENELDSLATKHNKEPQ